MARIYTRTGDAGSTGMLHGGRVSKGDELMDAVGDIDEAVSALGIARAGCAEPEHAAILFRVQRDLFVVAADLAANPERRDRLVPRISQVVPEMVTELEELIDGLVAARPLRPVFLIPGSTPTEAAIDLSRTVVRRAERHTVRAGAAGHLVSDDVFHYLNRLSDLLYVLARHSAGPEAEPASHD
ncbi:cob(I)yrinic acid a,c-diamide adenosyltransferase [Cryobacterium sp. TMT2-18-3]|uniref:cob(I)yrinic acid a,c-diamide adenosyltransferase n=1 Tax=unclassified Cryobacterium TaxID=2649013 RepID=UPI00106C8DF7|nr:MULTISPECIES: cob(I)yrinic acid a,c-diamide adenosyltransferase [unclassified Cryobacterium]TFC25241.1 cob(I)yrinic acid a,c-diamide adenosyltransferase [Cryobacterium sp. TMT2-18-2]TFC34807.1 cob(I)yrinic acid a,c-diamide adenosyltransferase [Cryobacterium sp. TMT2-42-4]TFC62166.1 cob(I)yrinic acid a,c-diamide adenosyltransferase [Cryobacterium sp. TMT2-18-3]